MPRYIDADEALLELDKELASDEFNYAVRAISRVKTADVVERKKGKWIQFVPGLYECSECGRFSPTQENFCPNCGANMREEKTDE